MTARLVLACLALSIAGGAATAQTPPGRPATTSQGPGTAVPLTDLLGGPAIPFSKPTDATEGRDMTLAAPADSARRTLPSAIAFPPRMPPRDRPGRRTVGPDGRTLDDVVAPADGEPVDAAAIAGETPGGVDTAAATDATPAGAGTDGSGTPEPAASADVATDEGDEPATDEAEADPADVSPDAMDGEAIPAAELAAEPGIDRAYGAYQRGFFLTAFAYALKPALAGDPVAQTLMGVLYEDGRATRRDYAAAADWFRLAAAQGDVGASYRLALLSLSGEAGEKDEEEAARLFRVAAEAGNEDAAYNLAIMTLQGSGGLTRNSAEAARLLQQASDDGSADATYALALLYAAGNGVVPDDRRATELMLAAAEAGSVPAQVEYAIRLFKGVGVTANEPVAAAWFERAAHAGNAVAMNRLARLYATGRGMEVDPVEAVKWHLIARSRGLSDIWLDSYMEAQSEEVRKQARARARTWWNG